MTKLTGVMPSTAVGRWNGQQDSRLAGDGIMRHNTDNKKAAMMKRWIKGGVSALTLGLMMSTSALAAPLSGKVFLDYDNTGSSQNASLSGISVEVLDNSGNALATPLNTITGNDGSYSFDSEQIMAANNYQIKASTTNSETVSINVTVPSSSGASGQNLFLKGSGGDIAIKTESTVPTTVLLKDIPVSFSASNMQSFSQVSDNSGYVYLKNSLKDQNYTITVDFDDILTNSSNGSKSYALWSVTQNNTEIFADNFSLAMSGSNQSGSINIRERNTSSADGVVAVDQDDDGIYTYGIDTGVSGMQVAIYYKGTNTVVVGQSTVTTDDNGNYAFDNLAIGEYTLKLLNATSPWQLISAQTLTNNISITGTGIPKAYSYLIKIDPSNTTLPTVKGYIFALAADQKVNAGPDSGNTGNTKPVAASARFSIPIKLYQYQSGWKLLSTIKSKSDGSYSFSGLTSGKDYKVVIDKNSVSSSYYFIGDTDGKSSQRTVSLSSGATDNIAGGEIILPNLNTTKTDQNFWYSLVTPTTLYISGALKTTFGYHTWNSIVNDVPTTSTSGRFIASIYEEDGVTLATDSAGTLLPKISGLTDEKPYAIRTFALGKSDHASLYVVKIDSTDANITSSESQAYINVRHGGSTSDNTLFTFVPVNNNTLSGRVYFDKDANNSFTDDDVSIYSARVILQRKNNDGTFTQIARLGTDKNGIYRFTNLPDGTYNVIVETITVNSNVVSNDYVISNNSAGTASSAMTITLAGGGERDNQDFWYKTTATENIIKGTVYLDSYLNDGKLQIGLADGLNDFTFWGVNILLCQTTQQADCVVGNSSVVYTSPATPTNGQYIIKSSDVTGGIVNGQNYIVKAVRSGSSAITNSVQKAFYSVNFLAGDAPVKADFLMKADVKSQFSVVAWNDINGDRILGAAGSVERARGWGKFRLEYFDGSAYQYWTDFGQEFWSHYHIQNLPAGQYRVRHYDNPDRYLRIANTDPASAIGIIDFSVNSDGTISDGLGTQFRGMMIASPATAGTTKGIEGAIYLDISGSGVKDESSMRLPDSEFSSSALTVEGFFTPRLYPGYTTGESSVLNSPNFISKENSNTFAHTAANSIPNSGRLYITNYLLHLKGLSSKYEIIANSGQSKGTYLSSAIKNDLAYMQVTPSMGGAPDQYYLVKLVTPTSITGHLYYDTNNNGDFDSEDEVLTGVKVNLYRSGESTAISSITTDANGQYTFTNLLDGNYDLEVTTTGLNTAKYELLSPSKAVNITINTANSNQSDINFVYNKIGDASISGYVMLDINNNGQIDIDYNKQGDLALSGITLELYDGALTSTPKTTTTNAKGYYNFPKLNLDTDYYVKVVTGGTGYGVIANTNTIGNQTSDTLDKITIGTTASSITNQSFLFAGGSNSNPATGNTGSTAKSSGISGYTYEDGSTTPLSSSVMISLYDSSDVEIARQMTDSHGYYHFYNLPSNTYSVKVTSTVSGMALSSNAAGTSPFDVLSGLSLTNTGISSQNFYYKQSSENGIQGYVYVDFANDNTSMTLDDNDYPLAEAVVELYEGLNASGTVISTTTTLSDGSYAFPNLLYGVNYSVKIKLSSIPDYDFKRSKAGAAATDITLNIETLAKAGSTDNHYLVKGKQKITGDVWVDVDGDLIKGTAGNLLNGVTVKLEYKAPGASAYSTLKTTTTAANASSLNGQYSFTALPKGTDYKVTVDNTSTALAGTTLIPSSGIGSIAGNTNTFETTGLSADVTGQSTAYKYNGKVSGQFIVDIDGNGAKNAVDTNFAGVALTLKATINGVMITKTAITDTDGKFSIDNLPIGNWSLDVAPTASQTITNWGSYTLSYSKNSAGTKVTGSTALPLTMAITASDPTFANLEVAYKGGAKISGYVVLDVDPTDGIHAVNGTDTPVTGLTMTLSSDTAGFVSRTVTTDSNGYYEFTDLSIHTYKVSVDSTNPQLAGHLISFDPLSTATSTSSSSSVNLEVSAANSDLTTQDFGYKSSGGLSGYIYRDISGSGTRHSAVDDKLAGVKIKATQGSVVRYSNVTTANGEYTIENLAAGLWAVEIDTLPSSDYSYSYIADTFGTTATVVTNGAEVDILPTAATRAVKGATVSFGVKANAIISGKVVIDVDDQDPLPPAAADVMTGDIAIDESGFFPTYVVSLYNGSTLLKTTKVVGGNYEFANLTNNVAYTVEVTQPSSNYINSFTLTSSSSGVTAGVPVSTTAKMSQTYTLSALSTQAQNSHFAWKGAGGVSGNVFWDKNDDGVYTNTIDSDVGAAVTVTLSHVSGSVPNITRTIASGSTAYSATGLLPGSWTVATSGVPTTFKASFDPDDVYSASSLATTANTAVITVSGSTLTNQHFGYIKGGALVGELKNDASASGLYNSGDAGVNPVEVSLLDTTNGAILDTVGNPITVNTNSHGEFSFRNLDPTMDYHVQVLFGSAALAVSPTHPLGEMDPSYDSQVGTISLIPPVSSTVDVVNETHTILAAISTAANNEITLGNLYFGYRSAGGDLTIHKKALKDNVVVGDIVPYTITIENNKATTAFNVMIKDLIPAGFKYVKGSARLDGQKIAEPTGGRPVFFGPMDIGGQGAGSAFPTKRTLTYMLVVGAGVTQGEYKNVAVAIDRSGKDASNTSQATVTVTSDPLFDNALIFGKVYVDRNGNGIQDDDEEGLGGVKLVTVRGEIITTDAFGRYHLAGVNGGRWERGTNFVLKLDPKSLPKGYKVIGRNPIVVRLSPGLPSKIDFKISEDK